MRKSSLLLLLTALASAEEGWVTHDVALAPTLEAVVRGRFHNERGVAELWVEDARTGARRHNLDGRGVIRAFAFREDGARFVASCDWGPMRVIDTKSGKVVAELDGHDGWVHAVAFSGNRVASGGRDGTLRVWDASSGEELWRERDFTVGALALCGGTLASTDRAGRLRLWDAATGTPRRTIETGAQRWMFEVAFSPDGRHVAAGGRRVSVFAVKTGAVVATVDLGAKARASALALADGGALLATAGPPRRVRVWRDGKPVRAWSMPRGVGALAFRDNKLGAAQYSGRFRAWDLSDGRELDVGRSDAPWVRGHGAFDRHLLGLAFFDAWRGIAVGGGTERGPSVVVVSVDDGRSWSRRDVASKGRLYAVDTLDDQVAVAVGYDGLVLRSEDRGESWDRIGTPARSWLASVDFVSPTAGFVVGGAAGRPARWQSTDAGRTWRAIHDRLPEGIGDQSLRDVRFLDERRGFAVGTGGLIVETRDGGRTWRRHASGSDTWLRAIDVRDGIVHVAGRGVLLRLAPDGATWTRRALPEPRKLYDVVFADAKRGWLTNFSGEILETTDGGRSWQRAFRHGDVTTALHVDPERVVVATGDGTIFRRRR